MTGPASMDLVDLVIVRLEDLLVELRQKRNEQKETSGGPHTEQEGQ